MLETVGNTNGRNLRLVLWYCEGTDGVVGLVMGLTLLDVEIGSANEEESITFLLLRVKGTPILSLGWCSKLQTAFHREAAGGHVIAVLLLLGIGFI